MYKLFYFQRVIHQRRIELASGHLESAIKLFNEIIDGINVFINDIKLIGYELSDLFQLSQGCCRICKSGFHMW